MFSVQQTFNVAFNVVGAFSYFRSSGSLGVPLLVQLGAYLASKCFRAFLMAPYSSEARGAGYAFYKEALTFSAGLISMLSLMLISGRAGRLLPVSEFSVLRSSVACTALLTLLQTASDLLAFHTVNSVIPYICCLAGHHDELAEKEGKLEELTTKNRELERLKKELTEKEGKLEELTTKNREIERLKKELAEKKGELEELTTKNREIERLNKELAEKEGKLKELTTKNRELERIKKELAEKEGKLKELTTKNRELENLKKELAEKEGKLEELTTKNREIESLNKELAEKKGELEELTTKNREIESLNKELAEKEGKLEELTTKNREIERLNKELTEKEGKLEEITTKNRELERLNKELTEKEGKLEEITTKNRELERLNKELAEKEGELKRGNHEKPTPELKKYDVAAEEEVMLSLQRTRSDSNLDMNWSSGSVRQLIQRYNGLLNAFFMLLETKRADEPEWTSNREVMLLQLRRTKSESSLNMNWSLTKEAECKIREEAMWEIHAEENKIELPYKTICAFWESEYDRLSTACSRYEEGFKILLNDTELLLNPESNNVVDNEET